jgi:hypothetical protein
MVESGRCSVFVPPSLLLHQLFLPFSSFLWLVGQGKLCIYVFDGCIGTLPTEIV